MIICIIFDFSMAVLFFLFGIGFYKSEGKAVKFLAGYNEKSEDERKKYDESSMCKAYGKKNDVYVVTVSHGNNHRHLLSRNRLFSCMGSMVCPVYLIVG